MFTIIGSKKSQAERNKASDQQQQAADHLKYGDDINIVAHKKGLCKYLQAVPEEAAASEENARRCSNRTQQKSNPRRTRAIIGGDFHSQW